MRMRLAQLSPGSAYLAALGWDAVPSQPAPDADLPASPIGPGDRLRVIHRLADGQPAMSWLRWGYTPATDGQQRPDRHLQARVDTAVTSPALRHLWREGRCLIPLDGWFEWQGEAGNAIPFRIRLPGGEPMFAAAVTDFRPERPGHAGSGVVLISAQDGNGLLDAHGHRPVILADDEARDWLDPATAPAHARLLALDFLLPPPAFEWQALEHSAALAVPAEGNGSDANHAPG